MAGASEEMSGQKQSVYMFPEGTRSYAKEPMLLPFKKGAFHLAVQAGVPVVPVVVANYSDVLYVQDWKFKAGNIAIKGTVRRLLDYTHTNSSSLETNRDERSPSRRCRRLSTRYARIDASRNSSLDIESKRSANCGTGTKFWRWSCESKWSGDNYIVNNTKAGLGQGPGQGPGNGGYEPKLPSFNGALVDGAPRGQMPTNTLLHVRSMGMLSIE